MARIYNINNHGLDYTRDYFIGSAINFPDYGMMPTVVVRASTFNSNSRISISAYDLADNWSTGNNSFSTAWIPNSARSNECPLYSADFNKQNLMFVSPSTDTPIGNYTKTISQGDSGMSRTAILPTQYAQGPCVISLCYGKRNPSGYALDYSYLKQPYTVEYANLGTDRYYSVFNDSPCISINNCTAYNTYYFDGTYNKKGTGGYINRIPFAITNSNIGCFDKFPTSFNFCYSAANVTGHGYYPCLVTNHLVNCKHIQVYSPSFCSAAQSGIIPYSGFDSNGNTLPCNVTFKDELYAINSEFSAGYDQGNHSENMNLKIKLISGGTAYLQTYLMAKSNGCINGCKIHNAEVHGFTLYPHTYIRGSNSAEIINSRLHFKYLDNYSVAHCISAVYLSGGLSGDYYWE